MQQTDPRARQVRAFIDQATQALDQGDATKALHFVQKAIALHSREAQCHRLVGKIYRVMGKDLLAQKAFATADSLESPETVSPPSPPALVPASSPIPAREDTPTPARRRHPEMTARQRRVLLDQALKCLAQIAVTEKMIRESSGSDPEVLDLVNESRLELAQAVQQARQTWRAEQPSRPSAPPEQAVVSPEYRAIPAFTRTLGPTPGATTRGAEVENLQKLLSLEGFKVPVSSYYDNATTLAVRKLQEKYGLKKRDGIVGGETRLLLNRLTGH